MGADTLTAIRRNCRAVFTLLETHISFNKVLLYILKLFLKTLHTGSKFQIEMATFG